MDISLKNILFSSQYVFICPPDENAAIFPLLSWASLRIDNVSFVLPETLVVITNELESTVLGRWYPLILLTWISSFDKIEDITSPIEPEPPIPAKTIWSISPISNLSKWLEKLSFAISGHLSYIWNIFLESTLSKSAVFISKYSKNRMIKYLSIDL